MKPLLLSQTDSSGGAARAAYRLHHALIQYGAESRMRVRIRNSGDWAVEGAVGRLSDIHGQLRPLLGGLPMRLQKTSNLNPHSGNWLPSALANEINLSSADIVNMHWVGGETLSIEDIGRIRKPLVWTLHDMWPFCGAEHYTTDNNSARWRSGYRWGDRPEGDRGLDLNRLVWRRKHRAWKTPMHIIAPSHWMGECARESALFRDWPVSVIPNVLDTGIYQPLDRNFCRQTLGLPADRQIILFGAIGGARDPRKGYGLLLDTLACLATQVDVRKVLCVVFGQSAPQTPPALSFPARWMGHVSDDATLALLYNAADVMVVPSRQENLPQTVTEPQSCACPVVAFDCSGFRDAVEHRDTGYLARAFDTEDMAEGIRWILEDAGRRDKLGQAARKRALRLWAPDVVLPQYLQVYESTIRSHDAP